MAEKNAIYKIKGEPASLVDIKKFGQEIKNRKLQKVLGDYIRAKDVVVLASISNDTLRLWRNNGRIRAQKVGTTWFYSRQDIVELIRTSK